MKKAWLTLCLAVTACGASVPQTPPLDPIRTSSQDVVCENIYERVLGIKLLEIETERGTPLTPKEAAYAVGVLNEQFFISGTKAAFVRDCSGYNENQTNCMLASVSMESMALCREMMKDQ